MAGAKATAGEDGVENEASWSALWEQLQALFQNYAAKLGPPFSPVNILATLALCLVLWLVWRPKEGFLRWTFPARVYRNPGFWLDVRLMLLNWVISLFTAINYATFATITAYMVAGQIGLPAEGGLSQVPILQAFIIFVVADLVLYWFHRLHHDRPSLWVFHAVHHSAEEMSPITSYRHHPIYNILGGIAVSLGVGLAQGLAIGLFFGRLEVATILGTNLFTGILNLAANNLKHSHIWMRFPPWLEHVLISPAQHQVHHSIDPQHFNRNYGDILAVWDWMFGTLYITQPGERIRFGLGDASGQPLPQRHPNLREALVEPVARLRRMLRRRP